MAVVTELATDTIDTDRKYYPRSSGGMGEEMQLKGLLTPLSAVGVMLFLHLTLCLGTQWLQWCVNTYS